MEGVDKRKRGTIERALRARRWYNAQHGSIRRRVWDLATGRRRWWDWGDAVMTLTGREWCGSYDPPRGRDMWYRRVDSKWQTTYDHSDVRDDPKVDAEWKVFDVQDDGHSVMLGYWPTDHEDRIRFYGLDRGELRLFLRWHLIECRLRGEWLGLRRWLYFKALHAHVERKIPFTCQAVPDRGSGGYDHWHCQLKKRHDGKHRFNNYTWIGSGFQVEHEPVDA